MRSQKKGQEPFLDWHSLYGIIIWIFCSYRKVLDWYQGDGKRTQSSLAGLFAALGSKGRECCIEEANKPAVPARRVGSAGEGGHLY